MQGPKSPPVGWWVLAARSHIGWVQQQLADEMGISKSTVSTWENDVRVPSWDQMVRLTLITGYPWPEPGASGGVLTWPFPRVPRSSLDELSPFWRSHLEDLILLVIEAALRDAERQRPEGGDPPG